MSPTGRFTTLVPLCFILGVSAIKELIEDFVIIIISIIYKNIDIIVITLGLLSNNIFVKLGLYLKIPPGRNKHKANIFVIILNFSYLIFLFIFHLSVQLQVPFKFKLSPSSVQIQFLIWGNLYCIFSLG